MSFICQGVKRLDPHYFNFLYHACKLDWKRKAEVKERLNYLSNQWKQFKNSKANPEDLQEMVRYAREYMLRYKNNLKTEQVYEIVNDWCDRLQNQHITMDEIEDIYLMSCNYLKEKRRMFKYPGIHLIKAFELAIKGFHYERVAYNIISKA